MHLDTWHLFLLFLGTQVEHSNYLFFFLDWKYLGCLAASKLISITICGNVVNVPSKMDCPSHISFTVHSKVEVWACLMFWWTRYDTLSFYRDNLNICHRNTTWNVWSGLSLRLLWKPLHILHKNICFFHFLIFASFIFVANVLVGGLLSTLGWDHVFAGMLTPGAALTKWTIMLS